MTRRPVEAVVDDEQLVAMLQVIRERDAAEHLDNAALARSLGWTADTTAATLGAAKARMLIWGIHVGGMPAPCFEDIELTVQGRRLLIAADRQA